MSTQFSDEMLMAFADGEVPPAQAEDIARALAADPALAARVEMFRRTRSMLREGLGAPVANPAADAALAARIRAAAVPALPVTPVPANRNARPWAAIAAAAAAVLALGWWAVAPEGADGARQQVATLLDSLAAGEVADLADGSRLAVIASYDTTDDRFCREYELHRGGGVTTAIACRKGGAWRDVFTAPPAAPGGTGYAPANGASTVDGALAEIGAGAPLSPADEAARLAR